MEMLMIQDGVVGNEYLFYNCKYKLIEVHTTIDRKNQTSVLGVTVLPDNTGGQTTRISGGTHVREFDQAEYDKILAERKTGKPKATASDMLKSETVAQEDFKKKIDRTVEANPKANAQWRGPKIVTDGTKVPSRSSVIDQYIANLPEGALPIYEVIFELCKAAGNAQDTDRINIISQAKTRYKWYTVEGKVNPYKKVENGNS